MARPAPPVPAPETAPHPVPRPIFLHPNGRLRVVALDWADARRHERTYHGQALHGRQWQPASGEERDALWFALARAYDDAGLEPQAGLRQQG